MAGTGSWSTPDVVSCQGPECDIAEEEDDDCIIVYEECAYTGRNTRICANTPFTDIDYEVKSLKVPEGKTIYLYNLPCFNGQNAQFTGSVECLDKVDFAMLEKYGINLLSEEVSMFKNPGSMQAKYRRPNLRKAKNLKNYQRDN